MTLYRMMQLHIKSGNSSSYPALLLSVGPFHLLEIQSSSVSLLSPLTFLAEKKYFEFEMKEFSTRLRGVGCREVNCFA